MELGHGKCGSLLPPRQHLRGVHGVLHDSAFQGVLQYRLHGEAEKEIQAREEVHLPDGRELPPSERVLQRLEVGLVRLRRYRPLCSSRIDAIFEHD